MSFAGQLDRLSPSMNDREAVKAEWLSAFAHEIRTPLATLHATLELLDDDLQHDPEELRQFVARLQRGVRWITQLVDNLPSQPDIVDDFEKREDVPAAVQDWIEQAITLVQPIAERRCQTILFACPRPSPVVCGDPFRLGQVMVNLLTNACRYGEWEDTIAVSVIAHSTKVTIRVSDHGIGILPEERDRIFEPLVRGTQTSTNHVAGQGLGLHIVRKIVESHNGTIDVESTVGKGSTFSVHLPIMRRFSPVVLRHTIMQGNEVTE
jgi:two-component system phosphate regulon sensor histidine kinase PhoR